jgi:CRP-like cAMP-binding protein
LWLIVEGEVEIRVGGKLLRTEGPGAHIGELALLVDAPRSADVVAAKTTTALQLTRDHLRGLIHANPDVAMSIMAELALRLRNLTATVAEILRSSPEAATIAAEQGLESLPGRPDPHLAPIEFGLDSDPLRG